MALTDNNGGGLSAADVAAVVGSNGYSNNGWGGGIGYSGHSIKDRMIAKLESLYDEADSEYDAVEIRQAIEEIRNGK